MSVQGIHSVVMIGSLLVLMRLVLAQKPRPSGTMMLWECSVALGMGYSWSSGILSTNLQGESI